MPVIKVTSRTPIKRNLIPILSQKNTNHLLVFQREHKKSYRDTNIRAAKPQNQLNHEECPFINRFLMFLHQNLWKWKQYMTVCHSKIYRYLMCRMYQRLKCLRHTRLIYLRQRCPIYLRQRCRMYQSQEGLPLLRKLPRYLRLNTSL